MTIYNLAPFWQREDRTFVLAGHLILSLMLVCATVSVVQLGQLFFSGFKGAYLVVLSFLVSIEAFISRRFLKGSSVFDPEWLIFRGTELVVILLSVKLAYYAQYGLDLLLMDVPRWVQDFLDTFITLEYGFGCLVIALVWVLSNGFAEDLARLYVEVRILRQEAESGIYEERQQIREHLVGALLTIGLGMILLTALLRSDRVMNWADLPVLRLGVTNLLLYFLLFLVFLSLSQFSLMRAHWLRDHLSVGEQIPRRWLLYSFALILGLTLIARLLPTGYSIGFLTTLNYLISLAIVLTYDLILLVITPFLLLLYWLLSLFSRSAQERLPMPFPPTLPQSPAVQQAETLPWLELLKSFLFWMVLLGVVGFSLYYYIRERQDLLAAVRRLPIYTALGRFWRWLSSWFTGVRHGVGAAFVARWERLRLARQAVSFPRRSGYLSLRRLSPHQRVMFYYLALVRRGGEAGLARQPSQTPYQYARRLSQNLAALLSEPQAASQAEEDIADLTQSFVQARYSLHPITPQQVGLVQGCWERLRRLFRII